MSRRVLNLGTVAILVTVICQGPTFAKEPPAAANGKGLNNPFFPYSVGLSAEARRELGYAPMSYMYVVVKVNEDPPYDPKVKDQMKKLAGPNAIVWPMVQGNRATPKETDAKAAAVLTELADMAAQFKLNVAVYPHAGYYLGTAAEAYRVVKQVDRKNLGVTLTLCHDLMAGNGDKLPGIVEQIAPRLTIVTINGADNKKKGQKMGWDRLIQPLGRGDYDVYALLKKLKAVGYEGPIGLQCYGLKSKPIEHLTESMKAWNGYRARMAAEAGVK